MSNNDDYRKFLPEQKESIDREQIVVEIPADLPFPPHQSSVPFGCGPTGEIYDRGQDHQKIAGEQSWWVLNLGWATMALVWLISAMTAPSQILLVFFMTFLPFIPLFRATMAKIEVEERKNQ